MPHGVTNPEVKAQVAAARDKFAMPPAAIARAIAFAITFITICDSLKFDPSYIRRDSASGVRTWKPPKSKSGPFVATAIWLYVSVSGALVYVLLYHSGR
jgi:hypothetical protein